MADAQTPPRRIYSYVRFSSERQLKGDSLKRQNDLIDLYTKKKGYELDSQFRYVDVGVPAFRGQNLKEGKLRYFIEAIREGKVPLGSILLIESLDRLTRLEPMEAVAVFLEIINAGVTIVTLTDGNEHSKDTPANQQFSNLLISITTLCRAHDESLMKSRRLKSAWAGKRRDIKTKYYTKKVPRWLKFDKDQIKPAIIPEKTKIVRRMFKLCLAGNNAEGIAKVFRKEKIPLVAGGKAWTHSYVSQTLRNEAVTGQFTPHRIENGKRVPATTPIRDYYPVIVPQADYDKVQFIMDSRTMNRGGRVSQAGDNLFKKRLFCGYCGYPVYVNYKGKYYKGKGRKTLICRNAKDGTGCFHVSWDYWEFEEAFVRAATELHLLLKDRVQGPGLREEIQQHSGRLSEITKRLKKYRDLIDAEEDAKELKTITSGIRELEEEQEEVVKKKDSAERKMIAGLDGPAPIANLEKLVKRLEDTNVRRIVADLVSQLFERIDLFPAGTKFEFAKLKRLHAQELKKHGKNDGHLKAFVRDNFDRRKVRFFQPVLNLPGVKKRMTFASNGKLRLEARLEMAEDLPDNATFVGIDTDGKGFRLKK